MVAFRVGGIPDWLAHEETGLLVPPRDAKAFGTALQQLLTNTAYARQLGEQAAVRVQKKFSFSRYVDRLERHLRGEGVPDEGY